MVKSFHLVIIYLFELQYIFKTIIKIHNIKTLRRRGPFLRTDGPQDARRPWFGNLCARQTILALVLKL